MTPNAVWRNVDFDTRRPADSAPEAPPRCPQPCGGILRRDHPKAASWLAETGDRPTGGPHQVANQSAEQAQDWPATVATGPALGPVPDPGHRPPATGHRPPATGRPCVRQGARRATRWPTRRATRWPTCWPTAGQPVGHAGGRVPWPCPMAVSHGRVPWPCPMAVSHGRVPWPCPMAVSRGRVPWPCPVAVSRGRVPWPCPVPEMAAPRQAMVTPSRARPVRAGQPGNEHPGALAGPGSSAAALTA